MVKNKLLLAALFSCILAICSSVSLTSAVPNIQIETERGTYQFNTSVRLHGTITPANEYEVRLHIEIGNIHLVTSEDGIFEYEWIPKGRQTQEIYAEVVDSNVLPVRSNTVEISVIGGPGPEWVEVGGVLEYSHNIRDSLDDIGFLRYSFGLFGEASSGDINGPHWKPIDLVIVAVNYAFEDRGGSGLTGYVNLTDGHQLVGGTHMVDMGSNFLWIEPDHNVGENVTILNDLFDIVAVEEIPLFGVMRDCWVFKNTHNSDQVLYYDQKTGALVRGSNWVTILHGDVPVLHDFNLVYTNIASINGKNSSDSELDLNQDADDDVSSMQDTIERQSVTIHDNEQFIERLENELDTLNVSLNDKTLEVEALKTQASDNSIPSFPLTAIILALLGFILTKRDLV
jgi:hypothetical protein